MGFMIARAEVEQEKAAKKHGASTGDAT